MALSIDRTGVLLATASTAILLAAASPAFAQTPPTSNSADEQAVLSEVVVTGTQIRGIAPAGAATTGQPHSIASTGGRPNPSVRDG